jgi:Transposase DDE domain
MTGDDVRTVFEQMLPQDESDRLCQQCGVIEQQRKLNLGRLVRAMIMAALAERSLTYARAQPVDLPGPLSGVKDWYMVDSTTVKVRDSLIVDFPGTGDDAALKVHKVLSIGCGSPVRYHFSPTREHDSPHLQIDESWRGCGLLADLAYASLARLRACENYEVRFVIRLKDHWKPKVDDIARGQVTREFFPGTDLDILT